MKLVVVTTQRPNRPPFDAIQRNALGSFRAVAAEVLMCHPQGRAPNYSGDYPRVRTVPVPGAHDLPTVMGMLNAGRLTGADVVAIVNADVVLAASVARAAEWLATHTKSSRHNFLGAARRYDMPALRQIPWQEFDARALFEINLRAEVDAARAPLHKPEGMDLFLVGRGWDAREMPRDLVVGAPAWDNKLASIAIRRKAFVDLTPAVLVVHQEHGRSYDPELTLRNRSIGHVKDKGQRTLADCTHRLVPTPAGLELQRRKGGAR